MSAWNPQPGDPWYELPEEEPMYDHWTWQGLVIDALIVLLVFAFVAFFGFTLGYFNVFQT